MFAAFITSYQNGNRTTGTKSKRAPQRLCLEDGMLRAFGIKAGQALDCTDFLKACLKSVCATGLDHLGDRGWTESCLVSLSWRFECSGCLRFIVTSYKDFVLRLDGVREDSFGDMLDKFWSSKLCAVRI